MLRRTCAPAFAAAMGLALLLAAGPAGAEPCGDCHEKQEIGGGERSQHPPFADDECTSCHADHGDDGRLLLLAQGNALCADCHEFDASAFIRAHGGIRGARASCLGCHDPHRSSQEHLLRPGRHRPLAFGRCDDCHRFDGRLRGATVGELCLGCHGGEEFSRGFGHTPVARGDCLACHDPHGSRERALLTAPYAEGRWTAGEQDYALCLRCHSGEAFTSATPERTYFRGEGRNYHTLHVSGEIVERGSGGPPARTRLSCRNCHEVHTSAAPRLIRRELDCGGVPCLKLEYRRGSAGGQCLSGCHAPQAYSFSGRAELVPVPAPAAPAAGRAHLPEPTRLERSIDKRCVSCHQKAVRGFVRARIHAPVRAGQCSACHLDHGPENRLLLLGRQDRICARCHDLRSSRVTAAHSGYPLEDSRCTECHDPHSGESRSLLRPRLHAPFAEGDCRACHGAPAAGWRISGGGGDTCTECHDDVTGGSFPHGALAKQGCTGCHRPHAADHAALVRAPGAGLCHLCHPRRDFAREVVHAPVDEGDCRACHPPHGADYEGLLARPYPLRQYVPFAPERYGLCWECHDQPSFTDTGDAAGTGFSDGRRNLHALHLQDLATLTELGTRVQPGVSCRNCHDPHATDGPRLIRRSLERSGVPYLQLEFHKVGDGGKCLGGCHTSQSYLPR